MFRNSSCIKIPKVDKYSYLFPQTNFLEVYITFEPVVVFSQRELHTYTLVICGKMGMHKTISWTPAAAFRTLDGCQVLLEGDVSTYAGADPGTPPPPFGGPQNFKKREKRCMRAR